MDFSGRDIMDLELPRKNTLNLVIPRNTNIRLPNGELLDPILSYGSASYKHKDSDEKYLSDAHFMIQVGFTVFFFPN